jgi:hypothetical protein
LTVGQTQRPQHIVEATGEGAGGALNVQTEAGVADMERELERRPVSHPVAL